MRPALDDRMKEFIRDNYCRMTAGEIASALHVGTCSVYNYAQQEGLRKSREFLSGYFREKARTNENFLKHSFHKGRTSVNKGRKMNEYLTPEQIERIRSTQFRKGHQPHNTRRDGEVCFRKGKDGQQGYYYIKAGDRMVPLHQHIWTEANGPIPEGQFLVFRDRNSRHCTLENLELVDREENMRRNTIHRYPEDLKRTIRLLAKAEKTLKNHERNKLG